MKYRLPAFAVLACTTLLGGCGPRGGQPPGPDAAFERQLQEQVLHAAPGSVIAIPMGTHKLTQSLALRASGVTLRGTGTESSTLSFGGAPAGAPGVVLSGNDVDIENLSIEDTSGDALVIKGGRNVVVRSVRIAWNRAPAAAARGLVAEGTHNLLIEDTAAYSAAGVGIDLSRSRNVIVRRCHVEQNAGAGLGIANTVASDVSACVATGNAAGIVISSAPGLQQPGYAIRLFGNRIFKNNLPAGAPGAVPSGIGVAILAASQVEIFDNDIAYNQTANVSISAASGAAGQGGGFDPYPSAIFIHDNRFAGGGNAPDGAPLKAIRSALFANKDPLPSIVWDGRGREAGAGPAGPAQLCVRNAGAQVLNTDAAHDYQQPVVTTARFDCELSKLPAVVLSAAAPQRLGS